jgi:hypothetical protein
LTAVEAPAGVDGQKVVAKSEERASGSPAASPGQGSRFSTLAHMGFIDELDLLGTIGAWKSSSASWASRWNPASARRLRRF